MAKIQPISSLRDTAKLENDLKENDGVLFITKNGYSDLVILSPDEYARIVKKPICVALAPQSAKIVPSPVSQSDPLGFVRVAAGTVSVKVGEPAKNAREIIRLAQESTEKGVHLLVLPELCLTGYTCSDLFRNQSILMDVEKQVATILKETSKLPLLFAFGAPVLKDQKLYNCALICFKGELLAIVPKTHLPNYSEFYEQRHFVSWRDSNTFISYINKSVPFGNRFIVQDIRYSPFAVGFEICEDLWAPNPPSTELARQGCLILANLSASNEVVGKAEYRKSLVSMTSARLLSAYVYADAGDGESTTDLVFAGHNLIAENGNILAETHLFSGGMAISDIDLEKLSAERLRMTSFETSSLPGYEIIPFDLSLDAPAILNRHYNPNPFIPEKEEVDLERAQTVLSIQAMGLKRRLEAIGQKKALVGLSGGLDSTLALLVAVEAFDRLSYPRSNIKAVTLPAFGTSKRTHDNASRLAEALGVSFEEINIKDSLLQHFKDIHHDADDHNVTYENAQARERTQVLMDLANDEGRLMIGTGDLSELCLGWTTYNGDHMSMYGVNASIPKTLVRYLCRAYAIMHPEASMILNDIIDTPISPELLPPDKTGQITQKTETAIGPYEVLDFIIYHFLRFQYRPRKLLYILETAYRDKYSKEELKAWLRGFYKRFYQNQFKRSCMPDGAKVGTVSISPRGDWRMPSDVSGEALLREIDSL